MGEHKPGSEVSWGDRKMMERPAFGETLKDKEPEAEVPKKKKHRVIMPLEEPKELLGAKKAEKEPESPKPPDQPLVSKPEVGVPVPSAPIETALPHPAEIEAEKEKEEDEEEADETEATPEIAETESSAAELAEDEIPLVIGEFVNEKQPQLEQESAALPEGSPEIPQVAADAAFIEALGDLAEKGGPIDEAAMDQVLAQTAEQLELGPVEPVEAVAETPEATEPAAAETTADDDEQTPVATTAAASPTTPTATAAGAGMIPPVPPLGGAMPPTPGNPLGPLSPNLAAAAAPNVLKPAANVLKPEHSRATDMLVGGVIGYLIGKRRGRIKTEEKLLPVQHKLEREVKDLKEKISIREGQIRKMVARRVEQDPAAPARIAEKAQALRSQPEATAPQAAEAEQAPASEARETIGPERPKKLGEYAMVTPELAPFAAAKAARAEIDAVTKPKPENIATMTVPELLEVASKVTVAGVTAERLFRSERLDAEGLRKVVTEYVRGGSPEQVLDQQLKIVEARKAQSQEFMKPSGPTGSDAGGGPSGSNAPYDVPEITADPTHHNKVQDGATQSSADAPGQTESAEQTSSATKTLTILAGIGVLLTIVLLLL